jgi:hypothetical protein
MSRHAEDEPNESQEEPEIDQYPTQSQPTQPHIVQFPTQSTPQAPLASHIAQQQALTTHFLSQMQLQQDLYTQMMRNLTQTQQQQQQPLIQPQLPLIIPTQQPLIQQFPLTPQVQPQQPPQQRYQKVVDAPIPSVAQVQRDVRQLGLVHMSRTTQFRHDKRAQAGAGPKNKRENVFNKCRICSLPLSKETGHSQLTGHRFCPRNPEGLALEDWKILTKAKIAESKAKKAAMLAQKGGDPKPGQSGPPTPPPPPPPAASV